MAVLLADLSHHNWDNGMNPDFVVARNAGIGGVIFKASQGAGYSDPTYSKTRGLAQQAGLLWGAYHFGTRAAAKTQVQNFLASAAPDESTMICLDFEENESDVGASITLPIALEFMDRLAQKLGRQAKLYTGSYMYDIFGPDAQVELAQFDVWWARYADVTDLHPTWENYWAWQFTDGHSGPKPHKFEGIGFCDLSRFEGTMDLLNQSWSN